MRGFRKRRFPLLAFVPFFQIEVVIAVIIREVPLFNSPDAACHFINEIAVVSDEKNRPVKGLKGGFDGFRGRVMELRSELGIPANLTAMGVEAARLDELTEMALEDPSCGGNPVEMTRENTRALFEAAM